MYNNNIISIFLLEKSEMNPKKKQRDETLWPKKSSYDFFQKCYQVHISCSTSFKCIVFVWDRILSIIFHYSVSLNVENKLKIDYMQ